MTEQLKTLDQARYVDTLQGEFYEQYSKIPGSQFHYKYGHVTLPKFALKQHASLTDILSLLGEQEPHKLLELNKLLNLPTGIEHGEIHTRLDVDEEGIFADSSIEIVPLASDSDLFEFRVNRPFYFTIQSDERRQHAIHYMGVVMDPTQP